ncbi:MAG: NAD(P)-dependent oxidoreductase [Verrucomicrobia bacterium]|nr:NAD(P)-dependent oxidoreductase [Verrucomicrobiota bacterium]
MKPSNGNSSLPRVGYVGLGIMGRPMAGHLLSAGYPLTVFNRTRAKTALLAAAGARVADSPRAVAEASDIIFTNVTDSPDLEAVILGGADKAASIIEGARSGSIVVDNSTVAPATATRIAALLEKKGVHFLDAPVTGGEKGAVEATLAIMVGGDEKVFQRTLPLLQRLGKTVLHVGPNGAGQMTKAINQILGAIHLCAMAEAIALAKAAGLDPEKTRQIVANGAAGSWMLTNLAPRAIAGDFRPGFKAGLQNKDLRIALEAAAQLGLDLPITQLARRDFQRLVDMGCGDEGTQAIVKTRGKQ